MTNRSRRFTQSLLTGYGAIVVNIVFSLVSIPLALGYLNKAEFGLWALALQINSYLGLIDLGMSGAVGRFLADHKDEVDGDAYVRHFSTGTCVFITQGLLVVAVGLVFSSFAPTLLSISSELAGEFTFLLRILCVISGISIASRALGSPLWAFQRMDVVNIAGSLGLLLQFAGMWLGFHLGYGVRSFVLAGAAPTLIAVIIYAVICSRNGYYPRWDRWFSPRWSIFKDMFAYGRDGMLLSIGGSLINATQITMISRILGLDAAASFSIATKLYNMSLMLFHKVVESAAPGLAEIYVRGEHTQFVRRYWDMILLTLATSSVGAVALAAGNSAFIAVWTSGKVTWSIQGDLLLGLMVLATSLSRSFISVFGVTKNLKAIRVLYFIEGIVFVPSAVLAARWFGVEGVIAASLLVHLLVTFAASARAASKVLGSCRRIILPMLQITAVIALGSGVAWSAFGLGLSPIFRLACASLPAFLMIALAWKFILPSEIQSRLESQIGVWLVKLRP
ncbi:MAG: lipopolysaccharide biosynthesis protein [Akkermansiaceae bacterium]